MNAYWDLPSKIIIISNLSFQCFITFLLNHCSAYVNDLINIIELKLKSFKKNIIHQPHFNKIHLDSKSQPF